MRPASRHSATARLRWRGWERSLGRLADGYRRALAEPATAAPEQRRVA